MQYSAYFRNQLSKAFWGLQMKIFYSYISVCMHRNIYMSTYKYTREIFLLNENMHHILTFLFVCIKYICIYIPIPVLFMSSPYKYSFLPISHHLS